MRGGIVPKRIDKLRLSSLGGTLQNPEQTEPSPLWGSSFDFAGHKITDGVYDDEEGEDLMTQLDGRKVKNLREAMRHPEVRR